MYIHLFDAGEAGEAGEVFIYTPGEDIFFKRDSYEALLMYKYLHKIYMRVHLDNNIIDHNIV